MNPYIPTARTITVDQQKVVDNKIDAIVSSVRPFDQSASYAELQRKAIESWLAVSRRVILFNLPQDTGNWQRPGLTYASPSSNPPTIKEMLDYLHAFNEEEIVAIVNADIRLTSNVGAIPRAVLKASLGRAWACTSRRRTLDPATGVISLLPQDWGLDFFCATVRIWNDIAKKIPGVLTLGRTGWDNWINSTLRVFIDRAKYFDITPWCAVVHTQHGDHFRLEHADRKAVEDALNSTGHPGGLPNLKLKLP